MIESREVVIFKAEVELFKQKYINKNFSSTNNQYTNSFGTPIYDVNNPDENLEVDGIENAVPRPKTYTLSIGFATSEGFMTSFKSQKDKFDIIKGFLEHIYNYYYYNRNIYKNWVWSINGVRTENSPPQLIFDNFENYNLFLTMMNSNRFAFYNDRRIILHLTNIEHYYRDGQKTFLEFLQENEILQEIVEVEELPEEENLDNNTTTSTSTSTSTQYNEDSLFHEDSVLNSTTSNETSNETQTPTQTSTQTSTQNNSMFINYINLEQQVFVNVVNNGNGNKYIFRNTETSNLTYSEYDKYNLGKGTYIFKNIPEQHPIAFLNNNINESLNYLGNSNNILNKTINDINYNFYWGDIIVHIFDNFNLCSIFCYYHGYMGGEDIFKYINNDIPYDYITDYFNNTSNLKKILCLHGGGQTSESFKLQPGMQDLINTPEMQNYEFIFVDSPLSNNVWWEDPIDKDTPTTSINHANISINYIIDFINNNGPFYGILGYSQGASMAIVLLTYTTLIFERVLLFNGYLPETHLGLMNSINELKPLIETPLIFLAINDIDFYQLGLNIKTIFNESNEIISEYAGHGLPINNDSTFQQIFNYIINGFQENVGPSNITLSNNTINENILPNTQIGEFIITNGTPPYNISLTNDNYNKFLIDNENKLLKTNTFFDYETVNQYIININVEDYYNLNFSKDFIINITNINEIQTDIQLSDNEILENLSIGTIIGELTTIDGDSSSFTYSVNDTENFRINGNNLESNKTFDYENSNERTFNITITSIDNSNTNNVISKNFTINVLNLNDTTTTTTQSNNGY